VRELLIILLLLPTIALGQTNLDSLFQVWNDPAQPDSSRLRAITEVAWNGYLFTKPDSAFYYAQLQYDFAKETGFKEYQASALNTQGGSFHIQSSYDSAVAYYKRSLTIYEEIENRKGIANAVGNIGMIYADQGNYASAIDYYSRSLAIDEENGDKASISISLNNIGNIYKDQGHYDKAIEYHTRGLRIKEEIGDQHGISVSLNNIGLIYRNQGEYDKAIGYHTKALRINEERNHKQGIAQSLANLGVVYKDQKDFKKAIECHSKSLKIFEEIGFKQGIATTLNNLGVIYQYQFNYDQATDYYTRSLEISEEVGEKVGIARSLNNIGSTYVQQGSGEKALAYYKRSLAIAQEVGVATEIEIAAESLWKVYKKQGKFKNSLEMYELYIATRDSLESEANQKAVIRQEYKYNYEKKAAADSVVNAEAQKVQEAKLVAEQAEKKQLKSESKRQKLENENQQQQAYFLYGGLGLALLFGGFIFNRFRVTQKQKGIIETQKTEVEQQKEKVDEAYEQLEEKNTEILDSINYAKRIQSAILPPDKLVKEYLQNSFILYKPKDIVAGDFYWMEPQNNSILFAAADCTGHGVPGAMVSVVCHNAMNRAVREFGLTDPGKILDKTREIVIQEFEKSEDEVKDGMDIALCSLMGNTLHYAGAHNPLWIVRNGEVLETKASKQPIGQFDDPQPYTTHSFELVKGDAFYIFSDGYVDQFGGERGKKFKPKALRELLLSIQNQPMDKQREQINKAFESWRGDLEQVDDVCMIGVKV
jgi:serine phosphatase RsbU (regulator of sigma subunit)/Tfp pilus assembly protein PilF